MKTLFDRPVAKRDDPATSFEAGTKMVESGLLKEQQQLVYSAVLNYGGENFTAKELSERSGLNYWMISRRLNELENKYLIERTGGR